MTIRSSFVFTSGLLLALSCTSLSQAADPAPASTDLARILAGVRSSDLLKSDLKYLMELAEKPGAYTNLVEPNIDIFLIGVDTKLPVRIDMVMDPEKGKRNVWSIPVEDLQVFIDDNLNPLDILSRRDRMDKELYALSGTVITGYMRSLPGMESYAVITKERSDVPQGMPHPGPAHEHLLKEGYGSFAYLKNDPEGLEKRNAAFVKYRDETMLTVKKNSNETPEAFELRKQTRSQMLDFMGRLFAQTAEAKAGTTIDRQKGVSTTTISFSALPGTMIAKNIDSIVDKPSYFGSVEIPADALLSVQINAPLDESVRSEYKTLYDLTRPVAVQQIDQEQDTTAGEKEARKAISDLFLNVLTASTVQPALDTHISVTPAGGFHNILIGIRCQGQDDILKILDLLPAAKTGWKVTRDAAEQNGIKIHELALGDKIAKAATEFYGASAKVYLAVDGEAFWFASGEGALDRLKGAIAKVKDAPATTNDGTLVAINCKVRPILNNAYRIAQEENFDLKQILQGQGLLGSSSKKPAAEGTDPSKKPAIGEGGGLSAKAATLKSFKWQEAAISALEGHDDTFQLTVKRTAAGTFAGTASAQKGILRAAGALVAKFSEENLQ